MSARGGRYRPRQVSPWSTAVDAAMVSSMTELLEQWKDFNVAMAGATAALAGLVIVAASVNIEKIVLYRSLTARLGSGIVVLVLALTASALGLMPGLDEQWYGAVLLALSLVVLIVQAIVARIIIADPDARSRARAAKAAVGVVPATVYVVAGLLAVLGIPAALYVAAAGALLAVIGALLVSWVALVEVLR